MYCFVWISLVVLVSGTASNYVSCFEKIEKTQGFDCCHLPRIPLHPKNEYELTANNKTMARFAPSHKSAEGPFQFDAGQKHILVLECVEFEMKTVFYLESGLSGETICQFRGRPCSKSVAARAQGRLTFTLMWMMGADVLFFS